MITSAHLSVEPSTHDRWAVKTLMLASAPDVIMAIAMNTFRLNNQSLREIASSKNLYASGFSASAFLVLGDAIRRRDQIEATRDYVLLLMA